MGLYQGDKLLSSGGKSPVAYAKDAGYTGTDTDFYTALADMPDHISDSENPHRTTASQVGAYTKTETYNKEEVNTLINTAISNSITSAIGGSY